MSHCHTGKQESCSSRRPLILTLNQHRAEVAKKVELPELDYFKEKDKFKLKVALPSTPF